MATSPEPLGASASFALSLLVLGQSAAAVAQPVSVTNVEELAAAVAKANRAGGHVTIAIGDGTYNLSDTLNITAPGVVLAGASADARAVVIQGDAMSSTAHVGTLVRVAASGFGLRNVTLQRSRNHLIQIVGEDDADDAYIGDCILRDSYEQMIKVSMRLDDNSVTADRGTVERCLFEYSAGVGPQYYIGGIDAHGAKSWVVRGNTFRGIASPNKSIAEHAIHFWDSSADNIVERNRILNCDRGVGFGLDGHPNSGGIIRNNMIYHARNDHRFADTGIVLVESRDTDVYNNTIFLEHTISWAIEYRFSSTRNVRIVNNLTNKRIRGRDGASGHVAQNAANAERTWFVDVSSGDLHLASYVPGVSDAGREVPGLVDDFDGEARPSGAGIDIGADEASRSSR